jgi:O-antigen/teichoic acid export membrane protein
LNAFRRASDIVTAPFDRGLFGAGIKLRHVAVNATSVAGTLAVTAGLGFLFWLIAARLFTPAAVGTASAAISAMLLLGGIGAFGMGTLLVREVARSPGHERALISWAVGVATVMGLVSGLAFAIVAPNVNEGFRSLDGPVATSIFVAGVCLSSLAIVTDQAFIGLLRGELQFLRNLLFALLKIAFVGVLFAATGGGDWLAIYVAWGVSVAISLVVIAIVAAVRGAIPPSHPHERIRVLHLGPSAASHFALNLTLQIPTLGMPILVAATAGAEVNASFYIAWLVAGAAAMIPTSLSSTLYAIGSRAPDALRHQVRLTLSLSVAAAVAATFVLAVAGSFILGIFGPHYASSAQALVIFAAAVVPTIIKNHFHVLLRIEGRVARAALACGIGAVIELAFASAGLRLGGVTGLAIGWFTALSLEALVFAPVVYRIAKHGLVVPPSSNAILLPSD